MPPAPRVLLSALALAQPMGGVRRQAAHVFPRVAHLLHTHGGSFSVLISRDGLPRELEDALPQSVERIQTQAASGGALARALTEPRALKAALAGAEAGGSRFDVVHTGHMPVPGMATPFTLMLHDLRDLEKGGAPMWRHAAARYLLPRTLARAAAICTVSNTMVQEISRHFPTEPKRVRLIPHGSDHLPIHPREPGPLHAEGVDLSAEPDSGRMGIGSRKKLRDDRPPILYLGHLERRKNLNLLLDTIARDPSLPHLLLVGRAKNSEGQRLAARTRELGIESRISILGPVREHLLPKLLATAGCMVMPSRIEGFGIPVLEAHRAGLPIAIARAGALPEAAAPNTPNFDPDNPEECGTALRVALDQGPGELQAAKNFAAKFTWDKGAEALFNVWCDVASGVSRELI